MVLSLVDERLIRDIPVIEWRGFMDEQKLLTKIYAWVDFSEKLLIISFKVEIIFIKLKQLARVVPNENLKLE